MTLEDRANEIGPVSERGHLCDHDKLFAEKTAEAWAEDEDVDVIHVEDALRRAYKWEGSCDATARSSRRCAFLSARMRASSEEASYRGVCRITRTAMEMTRMFEADWWENFQRTFHAPRRITWADEATLSIGDGRDAIRFANGSMIRTID